MSIAYQIPARQFGCETVIERTVTLKVKFADFERITSSRSFGSPITDLPAFEAAGQALLTGIFPLPRGICLLGLGLHSIHQRDSGEPIQLGLAI